MSDCQVIRECLRCDKNCNAVLNLKESYICTKYTVIEGVGVQVSPDLALSVHLFLELYLFMFGPHYNDPKGSFLSFWTALIIILIYLKKKRKRKKTFSKEIKNR